MRRIIIVLFLFSLVTVFLHGQTTVTYIMQDANFPTQFNDGGDFFNQGTTELGMWANIGNKNTVAWRTFKINGDNTGDERPLQVGDVFVITVSATRAFGQIGFSLNSAGTQGTNYDNRISGSRLYFNTDNYGAWYVNRSSGNSSLSYVPIQNTYKDYIFTVRITSNSTADVYLTVDGTDYRAYNLTMNGAGSIDAFSIYGSDLWDGNTNDNAYWKQPVTITNSGRIEHGYFLTSGTYTPGLITDGLDAGSTTTLSVNDVYVGGDAGSTVVFNQNNTYTGSTTINTNATLELQGSIASSAVTVQSGGTLRINGDNVTVASLTVDAGGTVEILAGKSLTVTGALTNNAGAAGLVVASGGSLIHSTAAVPGTVQRSITAVSDWNDPASADDGWHLISSPVAAQSISGSWTPSGGSGDYDFYAWSEATNTWLNQKIGANNITAFEVGKGYIAAYEQTATRTFTGDLNSANVTVNSLTRTEAEYADPNDAGFNLIGNPFPSAIRWHGTEEGQVNWSLVNISGVAQVWDRTGKDYAPVNADDVIPSGNGFMVQLTSGTTGSITIPAAAKAHDAQPFYKYSSSSATAIKLVAREADNRSAKRSNIILNAQASNEFDAYLDGRYLAGYGPRFYSLKSGKKLSSYSIPEFNDDMIIPFGFAKNSGELFVIELLEGIESKTTYLTDLKLNIKTNLTQEGSYSFTSAEGDDPNRFLLHFGAVGVDEAVPTTAVSAYVHNNTLYLLNASGKVQVDVMDISGRLVHSQSLQTTGLSSTPLSLPAGVYVVRLNDGQTSRTDKVIVQ